MQFAVLSSSSRANSTYLESDGMSVLVDCGLSARETERRLRAVGVDPENLHAIVVSHEHRDHIHGVSVMSRKFRLPVYVNGATAEFLNDVHSVETFRTGETFSIGKLEVSPFQIVHDAVDPVGFIFRCEGLTFGHVTDLGRVTPLVRYALSGCHALVLESNYDPELLYACDYPWVLKQRIASSHGHLSNAEAGELLAEISHPDLLHVVLGHLSENSNNPETALATVESWVRGSRYANLLCGSYYSSTPLIEVGEPVEKAVVNG